MLFTGQKTFSSCLDRLFGYLEILKLYAVENIVILTWKCISELIKTKTNECKICFFYDLLQCTIYPFWRHKGTPGYTAYILLHRSLAVLSIILIFYAFCCQ